MAARREQILAGATRCFMRDGFHATSMQDVITEAGVSAGGLYRHFASKDEIVLAIAEDNTREVVSLLDEVAAQDVTSIGVAMANVLRLILKKHAADGIAGLAVVVWGEVLREETLAREFKKMVRHMHGDLARTVEELQRRGDLPAQIRPDVLARVFFSILPGFLLQLAVFGPAYVKDMPAAMEALWPAA
jgi:TetR/AcrR family transcriptional regulator, transcriptional repressor of aconitase